MKYQTNHRFRLERKGDDPHSLTKQKYTCPACGKKSLTRYIDTKTKTYLSEKCGRCDRLNNCAYHYTPREYFQDHPEEKEKYKNKEDVWRDKAVSHRWDWLGDEKGFDAVFDCIPKEIIPKAYLWGNSDSVFFLWLRSLFNTNTIEDSVAMRVLRDYALGATPDGRVLFYQIQDRRIRTAKIMDYDPSGHRRKVPSWLHNLPGIKEYYPGGFRLRQCLFGIHLLFKYPEKMVAVVEAEKTACVMAGFYPDTLWLATGGATVNLNADSLAPLKGRRVVFYPDASPEDKIYKDWQRRTALNMPTSTSYQVDDSLTGSKVSETDKEKGIDLVDIINYR